MTKWKNKRVFISGGSGVIGTALANFLLGEGALLFIGDLKPKPDGWAHLSKYREGDLITLSKEEIVDFSPEFFFHLAATFERSVETSDFWQENFHHNILLSHHLLSLLKDLPTLKKIIFASSYLIYNPEDYLFFPSSKAFNFVEGIREHQTEKSLWNGQIIPRRRIAVCPKVPPGPSSGQCQNFQKLWKKFEGCHIALDKGLAEKGRTQCLLSGRALRLCLCRRCCQRFANPGRKPL